MASHAGSLEQGSDRRRFTHLEVGDLRPETQRLPQLPRRPRPGRRRLAVPVAGKTHRRILGHALLPQPRPWVNAAPGTTIRWQEGAVAYLPEVAPSRMGVVRRRRAVGGRSG